MKISPLWTWATNKSPSRNVVLGVTLSTFCTTAALGVETIFFSRTGMDTIFIGVFGVPILLAIHLMFVLPCYALLRREDNLSFINLLISSGLFLILGGAVLVQSGTFGLAVIALALGPPHLLLVCFFWAFSTPRAMSQPLAAQEPAGDAGLKARG